MSEEGALTGLRIEVSWIADFDRSRRAVDSRIVVDRVLSGDVCRVDGRVSFTLEVC